MFRYLLFFSLLLPQLVQAQVMPAEGSKLNYRLIGFKVPADSQAAHYKIEIASCNCNTEDSFKRNIISKHTVDNNKVIAEVPAFGDAYTWRYSYKVGGAEVRSPLHHFSTLFAPQIDSSVQRFRILQQAEKYEGDYVFLDGNSALYDMKGNPVWYVPDMNGLLKGGNAIFDLKLSSHNTVTFILSYQAFELNYGGKIVWKAPNGFFHHEFTHLDNGHYMVLSSEFNWKLPDVSDSGASAEDKAPNPGQNGGKHKIEFGSVIEYDEKGNQVWTWKSSKYFLEQDTNFIKPTQRYVNDAATDFVHPDVQTLQHDVHENAFFFDEQTNNIYVSFKNVSKIFKLKYPEGNILAVYGPVQTPDGKGETGVNLFCHQHSCRLTKDKRYLYLFNNNLCDTSIAKIEMFEEPATANGKLKKIWEYQCTEEGDYPRKFVSGGNVYEMPDGDMFVSMGSSYNKVMIVSHDKKVLWSGMPEKWNSTKKAWETLHQYRSCIITRGQLENLIWNSEKK